MACKGYFLPRKADRSFGSYDKNGRDGIIADLLPDKTDVALTTMTITRIRAEFVDFSHPLFYGETKVLISLNPKKEGPAT